MHNTFLQTPIYIVPFFPVHQHMHAGYWALPARGDREFASMVEYWPTYIQAFKDLDPDFFAQPSTIALAERLAASGRHIATQLSVKADTPFACLVHGDYKAMNVFLAKEEKESALLIDFQWTRCSSPA